ncbi:hypothetical protein RRG08_025350 [Elysia crispata]|uniref:Uncharacterized protein n=1 Tax=Elysia crispata TaxID=231223 RepID=A0AAE1AA06_9GAST|nr:hypothetical protein RRG08_025350 [Elysia crispata]
MTRTNWRCTLFLVLVFVELLGTQAYTVTTTNGVSGDLCPSSPQCLGDGKAICVGTKCRCQAPENLGIGHFLCHRSNEKFCAVFNDPEIRGFDGSTAFAPMSCKFKATHLTLPLCNTSDPDNVVVDHLGGFCDVKVTPWGKRRLGKTYIQGIEVRYMVMYKGIIYHHLSRVIADATGGTYTFQESTNRVPFGLPTTGPAESTVIPDIGRIYTDYDNTDNFARLIAEMCGVEVGIRGVDSVLSPLDRTAGVYIKVNQDCKPQYLRPDLCLCSPPIGKGSSLTDFVRKLSKILERPVSLNVAIFFKIIKGTTAQIFPGAAPALQELMDTAIDCSATKLVKGIERCIFILHEIKFLKCFDKSKNLQQAISLLSLCLLSICDNNEFACKDALQVVQMCRARCYGDNHDGQKYFIVSPKVLECLETAAVVE